ncbi:MAG: ABC transporter ATP-binding protein [Oscillospiraceae bacterium]|nr:ABC transporter ATP-binding protein [Oscillospiraceae bacterium]
MLAVHNLTKRYSRNGAEFSALSDVSLNVGNGEFAVISGHSGSGKSTLLNIIAGLLKADGGTVTLDATELTGLDDGAMSRLRNERIGFIPQGHSVLANLTVIENVCLPRYLHSRKDNASELATELLRKTGIENLANQYPAQLSGGELRRASIARALLNEPTLIIADEPVSDLDSANAEKIMRIFSDAAESGTTVLIVTHSDAGLANIDCRRFEMQNGGLTEI